MVTTNQVEAKKKGHAAKMPNRRYGYFRDDQIMFLARHESGRLSANLLAQFEAGINSQLAVVNGGKVSGPPQMISFPNIINDQIQQRLAKLEELERLEQGDNVPSGYRPRLSSNAFSILTYTLTEPPADPSQLLLSIKQLRGAFVIDSDFPIPPIFVVASPGITPAPEGGNTIPQGVTEPLEVEVQTMRVEDVSPNWLMSASSQGSGTGGPGGIPTPFQGNDATEQYEFDDFLEEHPSLFDKGANVDVAILDTAPCPHDLVLAPKEHPDNKLIQGLLGPDGKLSLYPATYKELQRMTNTSLNRHDYKMTDHGFFAAGIIHSIVPEAKIHLIEVLNQFGVGDLASLAGGLKKVFDEIYQPDSGRRLVVNCSWMLDLPLCEGHCCSTSDEGVEYDFEQAVLKFVEEERDLAYALRTTCNSIFLAGGQVVAAAGNDWDWAKRKKQIEAGKASANTDEPRPDAPEARYPAAFASVVGVGALPRSERAHSNAKYKASSYSNLGDKPAGIGIVTLGGEEGSKKGVLGLYLDESFPVEVPNPNPSEKYKRAFKKQGRNENTENNCWAWWAGTSFATPLLTGTIAAVLSVPAFTGDAQDAIESLRNANVIQNDMTDAHEDVMYVRQGD